MHLPQNLLNLYNHWHLHTRQVDTKTHTLAPTFTPKDQALFKDILWFIKERNTIWEKKIKGEAPPYTTDPILATYRFCNIFREFDRQTIEFHQLLKPLTSDFSLWLLNMFYCRMVARTETVKEVGLLSFNQKEHTAFYERLMESPRPRFGTPYVFPISVIQKSEFPTREKFIVGHLPQVMKTIASHISTWHGKSVADALDSILPIFGFNLKFLWTEVLIDVAYQFPEHIDLFGKFPVGPGSLPTMERLNQDMNPSDLVAELAKFPLDTGILVNGKALRLSAENWEGVGCEYRKYTNLKQGKGRKRVYWKS
jgi:hypothetical protein